MNPKETSGKLARILLLDDEGEIVDLCARILRGDYAIVKTSSPFEAASFLDAGRQMIDLVISDYNMPGMNGSEFVTYIRKLGIRTPVVLYTGEVLDPKHHDLDKFVKILAKPFDGEQLRSTVAAVLTGIEKQGKANSPLHGIQPHLVAAMENLENFLQRRGITDLHQTNDEAALKILGPGENYSLFLSWSYLREICLKIEG